jgi:glycosyltransferase involved in cell wall biosynthesis
LKKVQVLLSTFSGEDFLAALMDSLLQQDYPDVDILVRDDGSEDGTLSILSRYASLDNVTVFKGRNLGVPRSYFELIRMSSPSADYYAFCDQDDIWEKGKIARAVVLLERLPQDTPSMYCSGVTLVDEDLKVIGHSQTPRRGPSFENALVQNIATGCTIVINRASRQLLIEEIPKNARMHDWWMYLVASAFGKVIYDPEPRILYRQHSSNVIGAKSSPMARWIARIKRFLKNGRLPLVTEQASEFRRIYGSFLPEEKEAILDRFVDERRSFTGRLRYAFSSEVYRQSVIDNIILRLLIILNYV